ncbi:MAG TPA: nucleoside hydrolase, partial [Thermomicrobiales bacterium]
ARSGAATRRSRPDRRGGQSRMSETPRLTVMDVDTGIDDAMALALATRSPELALLAATTLAGTVDVAQTTANTLNVLAYLDAADVPVHRGASRALARPHHHAAHFHGDSGLGSAVLAASERGVSPERGPAAIIRHAVARPGELTLVCTGPLTNLAIALNVAPELPTLLKSVVVMGGAYHVGGNVTPHAEFNVFVDPEAAVEVFSNRALDLTVVGLDVTYRVALPKAVWEAAATVSSPYAQLIARVCAWAWTGHRRTGLFLHDPLTVAVALDPTLVDCTRRSVTVSCASENRGETRAERAGTIKVAETVEAERFLSSFAETLGLTWVSADPASLVAV